MERVRMTELFKYNSNLFRVIEVSSPFSDLSFKVLKAVPGSVGVTRSFNDGGTVIWQATAFTVAHCITLMLAIYDYIHPISSIVEPIIALSILLLALENIFATEHKWYRVLIVFGFGLVHGCGFASALGEVGLPENNFMLALLTFNLGVELGQVAVIFLAWLLIGKWFSDKLWYKKRIVIPVSLGIGSFALYWTIERAFFA